MRRARGWLLDAYIAGDEAVLWIKTEDGKSVRLTDRYRPSFYIEPKEDVDLEGLTAALTAHPNIVGIKCEWKYTSLTSEKRKVLRIDVDSTKSYRRVLKDLSEISGIQAFYNIDLPHIQWYLFKKNLPPTSAIDFSYNERNELICFEILDDWQEIKPPPFASMIFNIEVSSRKLTPDARVDPISRIVIFDEYLNPVKSLEGDEERLLSEFSKEIERLDPDFLVADEVDEKISYILERAKSIGLKLKLGREDADRLGLNRLLPYAHMGRVPLDLETFLSVGVAGIVELSRFSLAPPGLAARWPAGKIIDSRQCYEAVKRGLIISQSRVSSRYVKTARELVFDDRGSLILSPKTGLHENVGVLDFESMFPNIIVKYNISYETVSKEGIKTGATGFLPQITKKYLERRLYFKHLKKSFPEGSCEWMWCEQRQKALKGILVCIYGYSGCFANRFGNIACYEEINRTARNILVKAINIAMQNGFEVIYADSDSLFVKKKGASRVDFEDLAGEISERTGLPITLDKHFRFLVLLRQEADPNMDATRRYFGKLTNGELFYRGIETRRHDYPDFIKKFETKLMEILFDAEDAREILERQYKKALNYVLETCDLIRDGKVPVNDLVVSKSLRRPVNSYRSLFPHVVAAIQLIQMGKRLRIGEVVDFIYVNAGHRNPFRRVAPAEALDETSQYYDREKYMEMVMDVAETILGVFGFKREKLGFETKARRFIEELRFQRSSEVLTELENLRRISP